MFRGIGDGVHPFCEKKPGGRQQGLKLLVHPNRAEQSHPSAAPMAQRTTPPSLLLLRQELKIWGRREKLLHRARQFRCRVKWWPDKIRPAIGGDRTEHGAHRERDEQHAGKAHGGREFGSVRGGV